MLAPASGESSSTPEVEGHLKPLGIAADYAPPEKLVAEMRDEHRRVLEIARAAGLIKK